MAISNLAVSPELLIDILYLPEDTRILDAHVETYPNGDVLQIVLRVEQPDIPEGAKMVVAALRRQEPIVFEGWRGWKHEQPE